MYIIILLDDDASYFPICYFSDTWKWCIWYFISKNSLAPPALACDFLCICHFYLSVIRFTKPIRLLNLICLIYGKPSRIGRPLPSNKMCSFREEYPCECQLDQFQNGRPQAIIDFNMSNIGETVPGGKTITIKLNVLFQGEICPKNLYLI